MKTACVLLAFSSGLAAFSALALAMDRHYEDANGRGTSPGRMRRWMRLGGAVGLILSLVASVRASGPAQGWVLWFGVLTASALALVLTVAYAPRWASRLGMGATVVAVAAALTMSSYP